MTLYIDNKPYEVKPGKNLLETCLTLGFDLPYFCWHPAFGSVGACRQCAIKVFKDQNDKKGHLIMSCMEPVADNQRISISDHDAHEFRAGVIEWLMTNHPHDCAVCDEGGSCHLQDMTVMTGHAYRRFEYKKRTYRNQNLGPFINHEMNRCIQCYRCVRFYKDYAGGKDLDAFASKNNVYFGRAEDGVLESEFSGNLSEVCPTGVFTDKTLKEHYTRKWDLTMAPSVCQHCSLGCNIIAGERYGNLRMIANRYHGEVNGYFICDRGRFGYEYVNAPDRIRDPIVNSKVVDREKVIQEVVSVLKTDKVIGIGSPRASLESNFALKALVGNDHFYHGVSDNEYDLTKVAISILNDGPVRTFSMKEVEMADAVFILGEDLTNTAPMMALAVRQAVRQQPMKEVEKMSIPKWNDAAVRGLIQDKKGPLFVASVAETKLDELATRIHHAAPDDIARLGFAVAHFIDPSVPQIEKLSDKEQTLAQQVAKGLLESERPVIISGSSCGTGNVMKAAANVAWALHQKNKKAGIVLTLPDCNSLGLAMMGGQKLSAAFESVINEAHTVIILENDLYRHHKGSVVDQVLQKCKSVIVLDHSNHATAQKASILIPCGTFAESDGTLVSSEGRAQRFFQVYDANLILENWRWLLTLGVAAGNAKMSQWKNFESITLAVSREEKLLNGVDKVSPPTDFRIAGGQRIPREPHRYSGRTAMLANINVSEPKPPEDPDSGLSYTMEGYRGLPPSFMTPFYWSPGWNSVQSVNKYQEEVGASLRGGDPGQRLFEPKPGSAVKYFREIPGKFERKEQQLWVVPLHHIFGSEALSARSQAVAKRVPKPYIMIHAEDAKGLNLREGDALAMNIGGQAYSLPVRIGSGIPRGVAGLPFGLGELAYSKLPEWGTLMK